MTRLFATSISLLVVCLGLAMLRNGAAQTNRSSPPAKSISASANATLLKPGPDDGNIALATSEMLEKGHYSHRPFDDSLSSEFLDRYINGLDPQHWFFLKSDLAQFESYRTNLDKLTRKLADTTPAYEIFSRFLERKEQRANYMTNSLAHEKFTFKSDDRMETDRRKAPFPKDLNEAKQLWNQRIRYDYLLEKLNREEAQKTSTNKTVSAKSMDEDIIKLLTRRYTLDLHSTRELDANDVLEIYLSTLAHVYDPHSDYMGRKQFENFAIQMNLSLFGIGAQLQSPDGYCTIANLVPGGPAAKSKKLKEKDRIVAVAQSNQPPVDVIDMNLPKVVDMIRGPKGTEVRLTVIPAGAPDSTRMEITLVRDKINLEDQAAKAEIIDLPSGKSQTMRLGIIKLSAFYAPLNVNPGVVTDTASPGKYTSVDVARLLKKLKEEKISGLILDLRNNGGGSLEEAIRLTGLFIKYGPVVQARDSDGRSQVLSDPDPEQLYDGPMIVLVNHFTASASEILAGALQDYGRALIVGESATHGKGTVQAVEYLNSYIKTKEDPGELKVTIRKFYRPSGASTQLKGVLPDIVLPSFLNYSKDIGESSLENALPFDTNSVAKFEKLNLVEAYLPQLAKHSTERIATNQDFAYVREDIERFKKEQADKTISLNEKQRLKEMQENETRRKARDKERGAREVPDDKVYEITLKDCDSPGLPLPEQYTNAFTGSGESLTLDSPHMEIKSVRASTVSTINSTPDTASVTNSVAEAVDAIVDRRKPWPLDPELDETERILVDYFSLLQKTNALIANQNRKKL